MSELKKIKDGEVEITCTIEGDKWLEAKKKAFSKLSSNLQIKGFRKGQVPSNLAHKYINDKEAEVEAASSISNDVFKDALKEHEVTLIDKASLDIKEIDDKHVTLVFKCPVKPDVKLGDYKKLKYNPETINVTDKDVDDEINRVLETKADLELKEDGSVENDDTTVIDFEGFKDGVPFEGGKAENYELVIGSGSFIPGFEEQMIGMKTEEEKEINVTFPDNYHVDDLKGKPVVFKVKVHEIKKKVLPTLDDEFVKSLKINDVDTVDKYKDYVKKSLTDSKTKAAENKASEELLEGFANVCEVNIPEIMINDEVEQLFNEQAQRLMYQGINIEQYQKMTGQSSDDLKKLLRPNAEKSIKNTLCLEALAKQEKVEVNDEDINKYYDDLANAYQMSVDDVKKYVAVENIKSDIKLNKAIDLLKSICK